MRKSVAILLTICLLFLFTGCSKTAHNTEEMLQIISENENIPDQVLVQAGTVDLGDAFLLCAMTRSENASNKYYAAEFKHKANTYEFVHSYNLRECGEDMFSLLWGNGYVFLSNNQNSASLQIHFLNGDQQDEQVAINKIPFVYYLDLSERQPNQGEYAFEYFFLNKNGEAISK